MKKYILLGVAIISALSCVSQNPDSLRIDSLKKQLPALKDNARVDCLNDIAREFSFLGREERDSMLYYARLAKKEAVRLNYHSGLGFSLLYEAAYEVFIKKNIDASEKYAKEAIAIGEKINNPDLLGWAYLSLSEVVSRKKDPALVNIWKKALNYFEQANDVEGQAEVTNWLCSELSTDITNQEGLEYCKKSVELSKLPRKHAISWGYFLQCFSLDGMAHLYGAAGDYETKLAYLKKARQIGLEHNSGWTMESSLGEAYNQLGQYDSAFYYLKMFKKVAPGNQIGANTFLAEAYFSIKQYDTALQLLRPAVDSIRKIKFFNNYFFTRTLIDLAKAYAGKNKYTTALKYAKEALDTANKNSFANWRMESFDLLSDIYHKLNKNALAYSYLKQYTVLKDSLENKKFLLRLNNQLYNYRQISANAKIQSQIALLNKDNTIKKQELHQQAQLRNYLFALLVLLLIAGIFIFRSLSLKRRNEKLKGLKQQAELQEKATRLEMQALRSQMNPHFIFNCLSSINCFILENETEKASDYLTRFSRLIRLVLNNSEKSLITLDEELKMLRLYLDMERLRFENSFDYNISYTNDVDTESVLVPPLLLQPFCENAIWHGLMHKPGIGHLTLTIIKEKTFLNCIVTDDGIGRARAKELNAGSAKKEKSMGLKITNERLSLFNQDKELHTFYEMDDIVNESGVVSGTKVSIKIRHKDLMESVA